MILQGSYDLNIIIDGKVLNIDTKYLFFSISTSIWSTVSKAFLAIKDDSGALQEYFVFVPKTPIEITLNKINDNKQIIFKGIVSEDKSPDIDNLNTIGGLIQLDLVHIIERYQEPKSIAYDNTISSIVRTLVSDHTFKSLKIDSTQIQDIWYQGLKTNLEFLETTLLPKTSSSTSNNTPYFSFINSRDEYNFVHYKTINQEQEIKEPFFYRADGDVKKSQISKNKILDIARRRKSFYDNEDYSRVDNYYVRMSDGALIKDSRTIKDFSIGTGKIPFKKETRSVTHWEYYGTDDDFADIEAEVINASRGSLFQDEFVIVVPFNENIVIGKSITMNIYTYSDREEQTPTDPSQFSGQYVVEDLTHVWDGEKDQLLTKLLIGRKFVKPSSNYLLKGELE